MFRALATLVLSVCLAVASQAQVIAGPFANPTNNHTYYLIRIANYADYATAAGNLGGYPVVINTLDENQWIYQTVMPHVPAPFDYAYIGYSDPNSTGSYSWVAGVLDTFTHWNLGEPNNSGGTEHYASMRSIDGTWNDIQAPPPDNGNGFAPAIVEVNGTGWPTGYQYGPIASPDSGHLYYITTPATWWNQEHFAQATVSGHVAAINSAAEQNFLVKSLLPLPNLGAALTIGLNATLANPPGYYFWADNETVTYTHWASGEPNHATANEYYGEMYTTGALAGFWNDSTDTVRSAIVEVNRCPADFNKDGALNVQDIFAFLSAWFSGCP